MVLVLMVALMMAAMIAANAMPAFAAGGVGPCAHPGPAEDTSCLAFFQGQAHRK